MKNKKSFWGPTIEDYSKTPKYKQIISSIISGIEKKELKIGNKLPSVNKLLIEYDISRDTIVKAYDYLKEVNVIESIPGKGYYIKSDNFKQEAKVFLLFNKLSLHKKIIYDAFSNKLGLNAAIDFHIYHNNFRLFKSLIKEKKKEKYSHFAIIPHFLQEEENILEVIGDIPSEKLIILDKKLEKLSGNYSCIYQDFESDIYQALTEALEKLKRYQKINLIFPPYTYHPKEIIKGTKRFGDEYAFELNIVPDIEVENLEKGSVYISLMEDNLVTLLKKVKTSGLKLGKEIGIISYNETPLKEILMDGITTISTDFQKLGERAADIILAKERIVESNPFSIIIRNSL